MNIDYEISTLSQYFEAIAQIRNSCKEREHNIVWFRGHGNQSYHLMPSLFRDGATTLGNSVYGKISNHKIREQQRLQQYHAKNYHFIKNDNLNHLEMLGIAQHHGVHTRLLDWSTSAIHSLLFALEGFLALGKAKNVNIPCVWVLFPQIMNKEIFSMISKNLQKIFVVALSTDKMEIGRASLWERV